MSEPTKTGRGAKGQGGFLDTKFLADLCDRYALIKVKALGGDLRCAYWEYVAFVEPYAAVEHAKLRKELERVEKCAEALIESLENLTETGRQAILYSNDLPCFAQTRPRELRNAIWPRWRRLTPGKIAKSLKESLTTEAPGVSSFSSPVLTRFVEGVLEDLRESGRLCDDPVSPELLAIKLRNFRPCVQRSLEFLHVGKGRTPKQGGLELLYEALAMVFLYHLGKHAYKDAVWYDLGSEGAELTGDCIVFVDDVLQEFKRRDYLTDGASLSGDEKKRAVRCAMRRRRANGTATLTAYLACILLDDAES